MSGFGTSSTIECYVCGDIYDLGYVRDYKLSRKKLIAEGWVFRSTGKYCPECAKKRGWE